MVLTRQRYSLQELPVHMGTFNLHVASQHLHEQEAQTGEVRAMSEWWVERGIQALKACTTNGKLTRDPEKLIVNTLLLERALIDRAREFPQYAHLIGLGKATEPDSFKGFTDEGDEQTGEMLLHVGKRLKPGQGERQGLQAAVEMQGLRLDTEACTDHRFTAANCSTGSCSLQRIHRR